MRRSYVFEAVTVLILIGLVGLLCYAVLSEAPADDGGWEMYANGSVAYMFVGSDDTLYAFSDSEAVTAADGALTPPGSRITAIAKDGRLRWTFNFTPEWYVLNDWPMTFLRSASSSNGYSSASDTYDNYPVVAERDGSLYIYASRLPTDDELQKYGQNVSGKNIGHIEWYYGPDTAVIDHPCQVVKISPDGRVAWAYNFTTRVSTVYSTTAEPAAVKISNDRVLVFHDNTQDVLDEDGRLLFSIDNVARPAAADESGHVYVVRARRPALDIDSYASVWQLVDENALHPGDDNRRMIIDPNYMVPTGTVDAYDDTGNLLWSRDIGYTAARMSIAEEVWAEYGSMPLYVNGSLYVPIQNGVAMLDRNGNLVWAHQISGGLYILLEKMPADSRGNIYLKRVNPDQDPTYIVTIGPDGHEYRDAWAYQQTSYGLYGFYVNMTYTPVDDVALNDTYLDSLYAYYLSMYSGPRLLAGNDGTVYAYTAYNAMDEATLGRIMATRQFREDTITAYDVKTGAWVWNFSIPPEDRHRLTIDEISYREALRDRPVMPALLYTVPYAYKGAREQKDIRVYPGDNAVYLSYYYAIYEEPVTGNGSPCLYVNAIYALDNAGKLLWKMPMTGYVTDMVGGNSTIYYSMDNGRIGGSRVNLVAGMAIAAIAYMFLRFFMLGTVTRARSRLDQNENRNAVLRYIADNPGATATDLAKGLGSNIGTIRYHLLILTLNHKVVTYKADNKYLRYFTNAGSYSKEDRSLLSLLRREPLRKALSAIAEKPGLSGPELAAQLNVSTTAAHRDISLLARRGLIEPVPGSDRGNGYSIKAEHRARIDQAMALIGQSVSD